MGKAWVGKVSEPDRSRVVIFDSVEEAEKFVANVEVVFPAEVHAGELYIDVEDGNGTTD
jgi:hypothetical protein